MRFLRFAVIAALLALPVQANADALASFLSFDGTTDILTDESIARVYDNNNDGAIGVGDDIISFKSFRNTTAVGNKAADQQLNSIFGLRITSQSNLGGPGGGFFQASGAIPVASPHSLQSLLMMPGLDPTAIAGIFSSLDHTGDFLTDDFSTALAFVSSDGLDGLGVLNPANGDFYETFGNFGIDTNGDGLIQFTELPAPSTTGSPIGSDSSGMTYVAVGTDLGTLLAVPTFRFSTGLVSGHDIGLSGQLLGPTSLTNSDFQLTDKTTLAINPVPEPGGTLAIWTLVGLIGFQRRRARR